jgi:hypothetical protein
MRLRRSRRGIHGRNRFRRCSRRGALRRDLAENQHLLKLLGSGIALGSLDGSDSLLVARTQRDRCNPARRLALDDERVKGEVGPRRKAYEPLHVLGQSRDELDHLVVGGADLLLCGLIELHVGNERPDAGADSLVLGLTMMGPACPVHGPDRFFGHYHSPYLDHSAKGKPIALIYCNNNTRERIVKSLGKEFMGWAGTYAR